MALEERPEFQPSGCQWAKQQVSIPTSKSWRGSRSSNETCPPPLPEKKKKDSLPTMHAHIAVL